MKRFKELCIALAFAFLAAIIYEKVIDPNWDNSVYFLGNLISSVFTSYLDFLYDYIGDGIKEVFSYYVYVIFYGIIVGLLLILSMEMITQIFSNDPISLIFEKKDSSSDVIETSLDVTKTSSKSNNFFKRKIIKVIFTLMILFFFSYTVSVIIKHHYTYNAIIYIEKSLDIVAPVISEQKRLQLRADYRLINTFEEFKKFDAELKVIAGQNDLELPEFRIIMK